MYLGPEPRPFSHLRPVFNHSKLFHFFSLSFLVNLSLNKISLESSLVPHHPNKSDLGQDIGLSNF